MTNDDTRPSVLIISDAAYAAKANERRGGDGDEAQIITPELYRAAKQTKFIPVVTAYHKNGQAILPVYLRARLYVDFSQPDKFDESYKRLLRIIWDAPEYHKPPPGLPPDFVQEKEPLRCYSQRDEAVDEMLRDSSRARITANLLSRLLLGARSSRAIRRTIAAIVNRRSPGSSPFLVRQVTTNSDNKDAVQRLYHIEDPNRARWSDMDDFCHHLRSTAIDRFRSIYRSVCQLLDPSRRTEVRFEHAFIMIIFRHAAFC